MRGLCGFDAADWLGCGAADGAVVLVVEVDRDGLGGDVNRDDLAGVDPAEGDLLPGTHDDPGWRSSSAAGRAEIGARLITAGSRSGSSSRSAMARAVLKRSAGVFIPIA